MSNHALPLPCARQLSKSIAVQRVSKQPNYELDPWSCDGQVVKPGTNGGVSLLGTAAGLVGGLLIGCCFWLFEALTARSPRLTALGWHAVVVGAAAGAFGNLVDSVLGATLQCVASSR